MNTNHTSSIITFFAVLAFTQNVICSDQNPGGIIQPPEDINQTAVQLVKNIKNFLNPDQKKTSVGTQTNFLNNKIDKIQNELSDLDPIGNLD